MHYVFFSSYSRTRRLSTLQTAARFRVSSHQCRCGDPSGFSTIAAAPPTDLRFHGLVFSKDHQTSKAVLSEINSVRLSSILLCQASARLRLAVSKVPTVNPLFYSTVAPTEPIHVQSDSLALIEHDKPLKSFPRQVDQRPLRCALFVQASTGQGKCSKDIVL